MAGRQVSSDFHQSVSVPERLIFGRRGPVLFDISLFLRRRDFLSGLLLSDFGALLPGFGPRKPDLRLMFLFYPAACFMQRDVLCICLNAFFVRYTSLCQSFMERKPVGNPIGRSPPKKNLNGRGDVFCFNGANRNGSQTLEWL